MLVDIRWFEQHVSQSWGGRLTSPRWWLYFMCPSSQCWVQSSGSGRCFWCPVVLELTEGQWTPHTHCSFLSLRQNRCFSTSVCYPCVSVLCLLLLLFCCALCSDSALCESGIMCSPAAAVSFLLLWALITSSWGREVNVFCSALGGGWGGGPAN